MSGMKILIGERVALLIGTTVWVLSGEFHPLGQEQADPAVRPARSAATSHILAEHPFEFTSGDVYSVIFSTDGKSVLSASQEGNLIRWDTESGREVKRFGGPGEDPGNRGPVTCAAFSPDGIHILAGSDRALRLFDIASGRELARLQKSHRDGDDSLYLEEVSGVAFSPDGTQVLACGEGSDNSKNEHQLWLWNLADPERPRVLRAKDIGGGFRVPAAAFFPDQHQAVTLDQAGATLCFWSLDAGKTTRRQSCGSSIQTLVAAKDGSGVLFGCGVSLGYWEKNSRKGPRKFEGGHENNVMGVALSADGQRALSAGFDHAVLLWDVKTGRVLRRLEGHSGAVYSVAFSPDGLRAVSGGAFGEIRIWDLPRE